MGNEEDKKQLSASVYSHTSFIGSIEQFMIGENFNDYVERMKQLFFINDTPEVKKTPLFLTLIGPESYKKIKDLVAPESPTTKNFEKLIECVKDGFTTKKKHNCGAIQI